MKTLNNKRQRILANFLTTVLLTVSCFSSGFVTEAVTKKTGSSVTLIKPEITSLTLKKGTKYQLKTKQVPKRHQEKVLGIVRAGPLWSLFQKTENLRLRNVEKRLLA